MFANLTMYALHHAYISYAGRPDVVTFPAYNKDQILKVLNQRLEGLSFTVFHPPALELCARVS
jgi:Cdc6-like AAA superfamily ATPase